MDLGLKRGGNYMDWQDKDWWYFIFAAISSIGSLIVLKGKKLDRIEKAGVWVIFGGFAAHALWYSFIQFGLLGAIGIVVYLVLALSLYRKEVFGRNHKAVKQGDIGIKEDLPLSISPIEGFLKLQANNSKTWEFTVSDDEVKKLPDYPRTVNVKPEGLPCKLINNDYVCDASFHGSYEGDKYGRSFYIGSAQRRLGNDQTYKYTNFIGNVFGINVSCDKETIPVLLDFKKNNEVGVSRRLGGQK